MAQLQDAMHIIEQIPSGVDTELSKHPTECLGEEEILAVFGCYTKMKNQLD